MNRRTFLGRSAATLGAALTAPHALSAIGATSANRLERIGLELWTVRDAMERDPEGTLAAIRTIGYNDVELLWTRNNFGRTTEQVKASLERVGLRAPSAHIAPELLLADWERSLDVAHSLGHEYLIVPSLPDEQKMSLDEWKRWADRFNVAGALARKAGLWLAFHNEPGHLTAVSGAIPYDTFVERTDPRLVRLQLDFGNLIMGGGDPAAYLARYRDRYWSFHLKDILADRSSDTELGRGTVDFKGLLRAIPDIGHKPCYVEQENPADALASARVSHEFLARLDF